MPNVAVYVRDANYSRIGQFTELTTFEAVERHLGLGSWVLEMPFDGPAADLVARTPGVGIEVRQDDRLMFAGDATSATRRRDAETDLFTVTGVDDMRALHVRMVHPEPLTAAPPFDTVAHDTHSGPASTVLWQYINRNVGPGALEPRRWPELVMAADPGEGPTITQSGRWEVLLDLVAAVARPNGMSVLCRQAGSGGLLCTVRASRDRTDVELSPRAGTLQGWTVYLAAPEMTAGWAGGQGDLTERLVSQAAVVPPAAWPRRIERFLNHGNKDDTGELDRVLAEALVEGAAKETLTLVPSDDVAGRYGVEFDLGDTVTVVIDGVRSEQVVSSSTLRIENGQASRTFTVGPEHLTGMAALFEQLRKFGTQQRRLEAF